MQKTSAFSRGFNLFHTRLTLFAPVEFSSKILTSPKKRLRSVRQSSTLCRHELRALLPSLYSGLLLWVFRKNLLSLALSQILLNYPTSPINSYIKSKLIACFLFHSGLRFLHHAAHAHAAHATGHCRSFCFFFRNFNNCCLCC